jgi:hypothetical protein
MARKKTEYIISVSDFETDPFKYGRTPKAFCAGFYDGETYVSFWGDDCITQFIDYLRSLKRPRRIYFHNGGKFDFFMMLDYLENPVKIINGRIVSAKIGIHELRDSYAIIPIPLKSYQKDDTDYETFEREVREHHRENIMRYLRSDCVYLFDLVHSFCTRFGDKLTVGGAAMAELQKVHPFERGTKENDEMFRPFYFGGRVQYWAQGIINSTFKVYDINSAYPKVMRDVKHPTGMKYIVKHDAKIDKNGEIVGHKGAVYFAEIEGKNFGALPVRTKEGLDFNCPEGVFFATCHELRVAIPHGLFVPSKVNKVYICMNEISFKEYVDIHYAAKNQCKIDKDKIGEIFAKLLLNTPYGKFGQNPDNYYDWLLLPSNEYPDDPDEWEMYESHENVRVWRKSVERHSYFNVATAASITGAARAILLLAIAKSTGVVYCDTDSIILSGDFGGEIDNNRLGAWKHEADFDMLALAGKKMYAGFEKGECVKFACKGVSIKPAQIVDMCAGNIIEWESQAPSFKVAGNVVFTKRKVRMRKTLENC